MAFALLDARGNAVAKYVDHDSDPSEWLKGHPVSYDFEFVPENIPAGKYTLAAGIVDTSKEGNPVGIELALEESCLTEDGWAVLKEVVL